MIPNNNLSVLPWYSSIEQQNARKWWVYGHIYPLFTPAMYILPFQIMRNHYLEEIDLTVQQISVQILNNQWSDSSDSYIVDVSNITTPIRIYRNTSTQIAYFYTFVKEIGETGDSVEYASGYTGITGGQSGVDIDVPYDAKYLWISYITPIDRVCKIDNAPVRSFEIYDSKGGYMGDFTEQIIPYITIKPFDDIDVIVFTGNFPILQSFPNGQYYAVLRDSINTWYSEIYTAVNDIEPYIKIEWWDKEDFFMDAGVIVYRKPNFRNVVYLDSNLAKPEYIFEDEGETRDGYFFPIKQISEKKFRFSFFAPEYLLDVMRFIRMADYARVTYHGQVYNLDTFLITPTWEDNGDVASVQAEFDTATVAKKIAPDYITVTNGDFNNDFNDDFNDDFS